MTNARRLDAQVQKKKGDPSLRWDGGIGLIESIRNGVECKRFPI
jgi:hypothetical protein